MSLPKVPDRFQALEELARGETGVSVRARDKVLMREVVLRLPPEPRPFGESSEAQRASDKQDRERIVREARALAGVQHVHIVRLLDVIETAAGPVLVMEPASGETLAETLARERRLEAESVRAIAVQVLEALEAVHALGVLHRAITLDNILMCTDGSVKLTGFAFAKISAPDVSLPGTTYIYPARQEAGGRRALATPPHPAPEQMLGQKADARVDIFGLGWVLYECLTGEAPYPLELEVEHWKAPKDPRGIAPETPKDLASAVLRCLAKSPLKRFPSATALKTVLAASAGAAKRASDATAAPAARPGRSTRKIMLVGGSALIALVCGYLAWRMLAQPAAPRSSDQQRGLAVSRSTEDKHFSGAPYAALHAVVIGIDKYERWPALTYAVADARAVKSALIDKFGFPPENVTELVNEQATRDEIRRVLGGELKIRTKKEDGVFVFFAGHGQTEDLPGGGQTGYLVPVAGYVEEVRNQDSLIPMAEIEAYAKKIPAKHVFFAIDACFSGLVTAQRGLAPEDREYVGFLAREPARLVLTAGGKDQQVSETAELGHSYFTSRFLHGLENESADVDRNGVITAGEIAAYVQTNVPKDTFKLKQPQLPQYTSLTNDEGQFLFLTGRVREELK